MELQLGFDPFDPTDGRGDPDGDGLSTAQEIVTHGTNPNKADTDGDGLSDGIEVRLLNTDPLRQDSDGDGASDLVEFEEGTDALDSEDFPDTASGSSTKRVSTEKTAALFGGVATVVGAIIAGIIFVVVRRHRSTTEIVEVQTNYVRRSHCRPKTPSIPMDDEQSFGGDEPFTYGRFLKPEPRQKKPRKSTRVKPEPPMPPPFQPPVRRVETPVARPPPPPPPKRKSSLFFSTV